MLGLWIALVWLIGVSVSPALAQLYRWTDETGKVHITDNPETIPPAYRERARSAPSEAPASGTNVDAPSATPPPRSRPPARSPAPAQGPLSQATPQIQELQQKIAAARRERQTYLEQLRNERTVHTTPEFVRQRRQIGELGRALLTVERQLDTLYTQLEQAQQQLQAQRTPLTAQSNVGLDKEGHDATYWRRRLTEIRDRMAQARAQRRDILTQLGATAGAGQGAAARRGRTVLQQAEALYQAEQEIDAAEIGRASCRERVFRTV